MAEPFSFIIILNGCKNPFLIELKLRAYAPNTISSTPSIPIPEGCSPIITGEVIKRNAGVKDRNGVVSDKGEIERALMYKIIAVNSRGSANAYTRIILSSITGIPSIIAKSHNTGIEKSILPKAISRVLKFSEYRLVKRSVKAKKKAQEIDNIIQIKSLQNIFY